MWIVAVLTIIGLVAVLLTHSAWYDPLKPEQRVSFWIEAAVAYGTLALAVVTWGSVREGQDIIAAEDLRFRQARMPMVAVSNTHREQGGVHLALRNNGDGPAVNVHVTYDAHTTLVWNEQGPAENRDQRNETDVSIDNELWSSFMPVGDPGECNRTFCAKAGMDFRVSALSSVNFRRLFIEYEDVFGFRYRTDHDSDIGGELVPQRFTWTPPRELV